MPRFASAELRSCRQPNVAPRSRISLLGQKVTELTDIKAQMNGVVVNMSARLKGFEIWLAVRAGRAPTFDSCDPKRQAGEDQMRSNSDIKQDVEDGLRWDRPISGWP